MYQGTGIECLVADPRIRILSVSSNAPVIFLWIHNNVLIAPLLIISYTTPKSNSRSVLGSNELYRILHCILL